MRRVPGRLLPSVALLWCAVAWAAEPRFAAVEVYLESESPVAAWQFEFGSRAGSMKVVGVENGGSPAFHAAPYYDREAVARGGAERIIVADYSLADPGDLPDGRSRIATLHLMLDGTVEPDFYLNLVKAVAPDGHSADASVELRPLTGSEP